MTRKNGIALLFALASACSGSSTNSEPKMAAGSGIKIDSANQTVSIDEAKVPVLPSCASGQIVRRGAAGWECVAAAPDSAQLGGKPAAAYLTTDSTAPNASNLEGHPAADFLSATARAADSAQLGGVSAASYQLAGQPAANALKLGGVDPSAYLKTTDVAADSGKLGGALASAYQLAASPAANAMKLGGVDPSGYLKTTDKAADSFKLGGADAASYLKTKDVAADSLRLGGADAASYLKTKDVAADSTKLGGVPAATFARKDAAQGFVGPLTVNAGTNSVVVNGTNFGGILGSNSSGNFHLDADPTKGDGHVYLTWVGGRGTIFGNGNPAAAAAVASIDTAGNLTANGDLDIGGAAHVTGDVAAASFNGVSLSVRNGGSTILPCDAICSQTSANCIGAKKAGSVALCSSLSVPLPQPTVCLCAKF